MKTRIDVQHLRSASIIRYKWTHSSGSTEEKVYVAINFQLNKFGVLLSFELDRLKVGSLYILSFR